MDEGGLSTEKFLVDMVGFRLDGVLFDDFIVFNDEFDGPRVLSGCSRGRRSGGFGHRALASDSEYRGD
jgi:hypothetical protein